MELRLIFLLSLATTIMSQDKPKLSGEGVCTKKVSSLTSKLVLETYTKIKSYRIDTGLCYWNLLQSVLDCWGSKTVTSTQYVNQNIKVWKSVDECCPGYKETTYSTCKRVCSLRCIDGYCHTPDQCTCNEGYIHLENSKTICKPRNCKQHCKQNVCVTCWPCTKSGEKNYKSNCSKYCQDECMKEPCPDNQTCQPDTNTPVKRPDEICSAGQCDEDTSFISSHMAGSEGDDDSDPPWALIGISLAIVCVLVVMLLLAALFWKRRKESHQAAASNNVELVEKIQNSCGESCNLDEKITNCPEYYSYEGIVSNPSTTEIYTEGSVKYEEVLFPYDASNNCCEEDGLYSTVNEPRVEIKGVSEGNILYAKVNKTPVPSEVVSEENVLYAKVNKTPALAENATEENAVYAKVNKTPALPENTTEENAVYAKVNKTPALPENATEENAPYAKVNKTPALSENATKEDVSYANVNQKPAFAENATEENVLYANVNQKPALSEHATEEDVFYANVN